MSSERSAPDVCIIGAGLAGSLLAYELARRGLRVVVLETGPRLAPEWRGSALRQLLDAGPNPWPGDGARDAFVNAGPLAYPLNDARVKAVGGTTLHWGAIARRLYASDFRLRSEHGLADDWPISYAELESYYGRAEVELGVAGADDNRHAGPRSTGFPMPAFPFSYSDRVAAAAAEKLGLSLICVPCARSSIPYAGRPACMAFATCTSQRLCPVGAMYCAETHATRAEATGNGTILTGATVRRLNLGADGRIHSATYTRPDRTTAEQPARVFVVAAHAVESARLLLLSTSNRFPGGLANGSGTVGRHFMEHPFVAARGKLDRRTGHFRIGFPTAECHDFCLPPSRSDAPAFKLTLMNESGPTPSQLIDTTGQWGGALADEVRERFGDWMEIRGFAEQLPDPECRVTLDPEAKDDVGDPAARLTYRTGEYEKGARQKAIEVMTSLLEGMGAGQILISFEDKVLMSGHHLGTCRMGDKPETSVVNRDLRAHEVPNLYLAGSSVFVTGGSVNPSLTIAALTLRLAETIAARGA